MTEPREAPALPWPGRRGHPSPQRPVGGLGTRLLPRAKGTPRAAGRGLWRQEGRDSRGGGHWRPCGPRRLRAPGGESGCRGRDPVWSPPACSPAPPFLPDRAYLEGAGSALSLPCHPTAGLQPGREQGVGRGAAGRLPGSLPWAPRPGLCGNGRLDGPAGTRCGPRAPVASLPQSPTVDPVTPLLGPLAPGASAWRGNRHKQSGPRASCRVHR